MTVGQPALAASEASRERLARFAIGVLFILMGLAFLLLLRFDYFDFHYARFVGPTFARPTSGDYIFTRGLFETEECWLLGLGLCWAGVLTLGNKDLGRKLGIVLSLITLPIALLFSYLAFVLLATAPRHNWVNISQFPIGFPVCIVISLAGLAYFLTWGRKLDRGRSRNWVWAAGGVIVLALIVAAGSTSGVLK